jgi:hypothetical protein
VNSASKMKLVSLASFETLIQFLRIKKYRKEVVQITGATKLFVFKTLNPVLFNSFFNPSCEKRIKCLG